MRRQTVFNAAFLAGLLIAGGLCGLEANRIGGISRLHAQLEGCILSSKQAHLSEDARSTLAHLDEEVPACMNGAGYERALNNKGCSLAMWQGDIFCYLPKSALGKLIYRMEASLKRSSIDDASRQP